MFKSLLVPLDGSEFSERSLPLVREVARASGASLHFAHVQELSPPEDLFTTSQFHRAGRGKVDRDGRHREAKNDYLASVVDSLDGSDSPADCAVLEGNVAEELATYAEHVGAEAIFMTTRARTGMRRMWSGSVADALIRRTNLPLLALHASTHGSVRADVRTFDHGLVLLDGSDLAEAILEPAGDLAQATGARLTLTHVVSPRAVSGARYLGTSRDDIGPSMNKAEDYLGGVADRLRAKGIQVATCVRAAERAAPAIERVAEKLGADLIAIATHGYSGFKRAFFGSVAEEILRRSPVPVLVRQPTSGRRRTSRRGSVGLDAILRSAPASQQSAPARDRPIQLKVVRRNSPFYGQGQ